MACLQKLILVIGVILFCGCSSENKVGVTGKAGRGSAATTSIEGLKIEAEPTGNDGGSVSTREIAGDTWIVAISGVEVVVKRRDDGSLDVKIGGKDYGTFKQEDHLFINHKRDVFLNNERITPKDSGAKKSNDN